MVGSVFSRRCARLATRAAVATVAVTLANIAPSSPAGAARSATSLSVIDVQSQPFAITSSSTTRFRIVLPSDAQDATSITISVHRRATSRESVTLIADGESELRVIDDVQIPVSSLARFGSRGLVVPVTFQLAGSTNALNLPFPGIFPITISAQKSSTVLASTRTFVAYVDTADSGTPIATSIVLTQTAPPSRAPDGTLDILGATRTSVQKLITMLNDVRAPFTLQLQPETIAALAESESPGDKVLLDSLSASLAGHTVVASTYVPMDPSSAEGSGIANEFTRQLRLGETTLQQVLPNVRLSRSAWISHDPMTERGASLLRDLGSTSLVLIPSGTNVTNASLESLVSRATLQDDTLMSAVLADSQITRLLEDPSRNDVRTGIRVAAEILAKRQELLDAGTPASAARIVVATSTDVLSTSVALTSLARALESVPGIALKDFSVGLPPSADAPAITFAEQPARDISLIGAALFSVGLDRIAVGSMLPDDSPEPLLWDKMLSILPATTLSDPEKYVLGIRQLMREVKLSVVPPAASTFTLGDRKATIRLQIRNSSTSTLKVRVTLSSAKLLFPEPPPIVELVPNASTDVVVPVVARSNGRFPVTVRITTPTGDARVSAPIILTARVNIIAGLGQFISFGALTLLLLWWAVSWMRSRRRKRTTTVGTP